MNQSPSDQSHIYAEKKPRYYQAMLFIYPLVLLVIFESLKPDRGFLPLLTAHDHFFIGLLVVALNYLVYLSLLFLLYSLTKSMFATSIILSVGLLVFYGINYYRWMNTGQVFTPQDMVFAGNFFTILPFAVIRPDIKIVLTLLGLLICIGFFYYNRKIYRQNAPAMAKRWILALVCLVFLGFVVVPAGKTAIAQGLNLKPEEMWQLQEKLYTENGNLLGFLLLTGSKPARQEAPVEKSYYFNPDTLRESYSPEQMQSVLDNIKQTPAEYQGTTGVKPNVIIIMSEAFWDPKQLTRIEFSQDPIPNYSRLAEQYKGGNILTPAIGGLTCNVEYELLLMDSMLFYQDGAVPFERGTKMLPQEDRLALPWQFKENGYRTVAVHPYDRYFYHRGEFYPRLGFDQFIAKDDMKDAEVRGEFISDEYFTSRIIQEIEQTEEPLFLFGISMENHYPYSPHRYPNQDVKLSSQTAKIPELMPISTYTQGVHDADAALGQLIAYLEEQAEPTLLFFFGDHLPILEARVYDTYAHNGYISSSEREEWTLQDTQKMYNTPYLYWSNYKEEMPEFQDLSPLFIGPVLLNEAGLQSSPYTSYLIDSMEEFQGLHHQLYIDGQGLYSPMSPELGGKRLENLYYIHLDRFQTDPLTGQRYIFEQIRDRDTNVPSD